MKLTKKKAIEQTRAKWDWYYHHPSKRHLKDYPECEEWGYLSNCPCCEYVAQRVKHFSLDKSDCIKYCPLKWPAGICCPSDLSNGTTQDYFWQWHYAKNDYYRKKYAKLIRDLPERK